MANNKLNNELKKILKKLDPDKKIIGKRIADEIIFIQETLSDLKEQIRENGTVEQFIQGKQNFLRESPSLKSYNNLVQRYSQLFKQFTELLPKDQVSENVSEILSFLNE